MNKMTEYYYINTILEQFFKDRYPYDTDKTDYVQLLRGMNDEETIKGLVKAYNKLLDKILSLQYNLLTKPDDWYRYNHLPNENSSLLKELDYFLNKQIERVFDSCDEITEEMELQCLVNLRPAKNRNNIIQNILSKCSEHVKNEYEEIKTSIIIKEEAPEHLTPYNIQTNEYNANLLPYVQAMKTLIKSGYIKDLRDSAFESHAKISYIQDTRSFIIIIVSIVIVIPIAIFLVYAIGKAIFFVLIILSLLSFIWKGR